MQERLDKGMLSVFDLERLFAPTEREQQVIMTPSCTGFVGVVFSLEGCLLDLETVYGYTYASFAADVGQSVPVPSQVRDIIGCASLYEACVSLRWPLSKEIVAKCEDRFFELFEKYLLALPPPAIQPGAVAAIEQVLLEDNRLTVNTALPRSLATTALGRSGLSSLLQARVDPNCLVHPDQDKNANKARVGMGLGGLEGQQLVRCCALMKRTPMLSVLVDSNRRNLLQGKRMGMNVFALQGYSSAVYLRASDKVLSDASQFSMKDAYKVVRRAIENSEGQRAAPDSVAVLRPTITKSISAPATDDDRVRDTFADADEGSSDTL